ncbi:MAG: aldo/keto reductase [Proteobacteria bacterium]|nr:aldo/keto reductase [Pseudomonadota bacterium]
MSGPRLRLPRIGLGCATLGATRLGLSEADAMSIVHRALARGIRLFDTAALYGGGQSESRLGKALAGVPRSELIIATKLGRYRAEGDLPPIDGGSGDCFDYAYDRTLRAVDESLQRLGVDHLDIVHVHDCDAHVEEALAGTIPALKRLQDEGVVGAVGAGLNTVAPALELIRRVELDALLIAGRYTLLDRSAEAELLPRAAERGIAVILGGILNSGALAAQDLDRATFDYRPLEPAMRDRILAVRKVCAMSGISQTTAALQFPLRHPAVASVLLGVAEPAQIDANLDALSVPISDNAWSAMTRIGQSS